jgi:hypothetical protein
MAFFILPLFSARDLDIGPRALANASPVNSICDHQIPKMEVAIVFLALLPIILSMTLEEHEAQWRQMSHEERLSGMCDVKYIIRR